jgi:outer membrane protein OmpA-like peptidoglycan-associated protein
MTRINPRGVMLRRTLIATTVTSVLLAACAAAPVKPDGAEEARNKLTQLQSDPNLATRAPVAMKEADSAVRVAEQPQPDKELAAYRVYLADRKVDIARAQAETSLAEDQRTALSAQRERARLDARTREADAAHLAAANSEHQADAANLAAASSEHQADAANLAAANSQQQAAELQRQIEVLQARPTDRGLVLTLGDVLFETGRSGLKMGATGNLNKLVAFLNEYPDRTALIEGYTDSVGTEDYNQGLSERRADSVKSYLVGEGIGTTRLSASGRGERDPVASNDSAAGRQQNRRVEVIISNPAAAVR